MAPLVISFSHCSLSANSRSDSARGREAAEGVGDIEPIACPCEAFFDLFLSFQRHRSLERRSYGRCSSRTTPSGGAGDW
jgi:hypothetical protein